MSLPERTERKVYAIHNRDCREALALKAKKPPEGGSLNPGLDTRHARALGLLRVAATQPENYPQDDRHQLRDDALHRGVDP